MSTVTYKHQPGIHKTRGTIPLAGTSHLYTVSKVLWPDSIQEFLQTLLVGTTLHACCGASLLGDIRLDLDKNQKPDIICDVARLCFADDSVDTILCDPPYNGKFQWNHDLLSELSRVAKQRLIFQHWFLACDNYGRYKKSHKFILVALYNWQSKTYFGRVNTIQVYDNVEN